MGTPDDSRVVTSHFLVVRYPNFDTSGSRDVYWGGVTYSRQPELALHSQVHPHERKASKKKRGERRDAEHRRGLFRESIDDTLDSVYESTLVKIDE